MTIRHKNQAIVPKIYLARNLQKEKADKIGIWSWWADLNRRPIDYEGTARVPVIVCSSLDKPLIFRHLRLYVKKKLGVRIRSIYTYFTPNIIVLQIFDGFNRPKTD